MSRISNRIHRRRTRIVDDMVAAGLSHGLVAAEAVRRGEAAYYGVKRYIHEHDMSEEDQLRLVKLTIAALHARGNEAGYWVAVRAGEALSLICQHRPKS